MSHVSPRAGAWIRIVFHCLLPLSSVTAYGGTAYATTAEHIQRHLQVRAGATCLNAVQIALQVEQWLYDSPDPSGYLFIVEGSPTKSRHVRVRVTRDGRTIAHRAFEPGPAQCQHLQAAVGLTIALALKASFLDDLGRPLPDDPHVRRNSWTIGAAVLATYHVLPKLAPGLTLFAEHPLSEQFTVRLGALGVAARNIPLDQGNGTFHSVLGAAKADLCTVATITSALRADICLNGMGGVLRSQGANVDNPTGASAAWFAAANSVDMRFNLSRHWSLQLGVAAQLLLPTIRIGLRDADGAQVGSLSLPRMALSTQVGVLHHR